MSKPTVDELERILDGNALPTIILPNGEIKLDYKHCAHRSECHASKKEESAPSASSNIDYTAALADEVTSYCEDEYLTMTRGMVHKLATRLNAAIQKKNCE